MAMSAVYTNFGGRIVHEKRGAESYRHCSDPLGSSVAVIDSSDGSTVYEAEYWPYGEVQTETGSNPGSLGFVGLLGYFRDLGSLLYVRARHLEPQKGRWQTVDPIWPKRKPYAYCSNKPVKVVDPSGMLDFEGCPDVIEKQIRNLCRKIRNLSPNVVDRINQCINQNSPKGIRCPGITPDRLKDMADWCRGNHLVKCREDWMPPPVGTPAAFAHYDGSISLWWLKSGTNKHIDIFPERNVRCAENGRTISLRNISVNFLHELGHQVDIWHETDDDFWQCNDVFSTCVYMYVQ